MGKQHATRALESEDCPCCAVMTRDEILARHSYFVHRQLRENLRELPSYPSGDEQAPDGSNIEDSALHSSSEVTGEVG